MTARMIVVHDAEDMVDPAALNLLDSHIGRADLVQLPVLPHPLSDVPGIVTEVRREDEEQQKTQTPVQETVTPTPANER